MARFEIALAAAALIPALSWGADAPNSASDPLSALRADVAMRAAPLKAPAARDISVFISNTVLAAFGQAWDAQPNRTVRFQSIGFQGHIAESGGGGLGCGWYAEIHNLNFDLTVLNIAVTPTSAGYAFNVAYVGAMTAQVAGHVNGPAGLYHDHFWEVPWLTCSHPVGGGVGTSVGVSAQHNDALHGVVALTAEPGSWLGYRAVLAGNPHQSVTLSIGLGHGIPNLGQPIGFDIPDTVLASGNLPPLIENKGQMQAGQTLRKFTFKVVPASSAIVPNGVIAVASADLVWDTQ